jgi:hypothetical protein
VVAAPAVPTRDPDGEALPDQSLHLATPQDLPNKVVGAFSERVVSRVDPEAGVVSRARVVADRSSKVHAGVDAGRARMVTAVEASGGATAADQLLQRLVAEHEGNVGRRVREVGAATKDGTVETDRWLGGRGIRAAIPRVDKGATKPGLPPRAFAYDPHTDSFRCPQGQRLTRQGVLTTAAGLPITLSQARPQQCAPCPRKGECCGPARARSLAVADDGGVRARAALSLATFPARQSVRRRKAWIETIFGDGKERRGRRRARCRGLDRMRAQAWMTAIAQNVRQLARGKGTRPATGSGARESSSPLPVCSSLPRLPRAQPAPNHDLTLGLAQN